MTPELVTSIATLVAALGAILIGWRNSRKTDATKEKAALAAAHAEVAKAAVEANKREIVMVGDKVMTVGEQIDGRLTQLVNEARLAARAEGVLAAEQAQRDRVATAEATKPQSTDPEPV